MTEKWDYEKYNKIVKEWVADLGGDIMNERELTEHLIKTFGVHVQTRKGHYDGLMAHRLMANRMDGTFQLVPDATIDGPKPEPTPAAPCPGEPETEETTEETKEEPQDEKPEEVTPEA